MAKYIIDLPSDLYDVYGTLRVPVRVGKGDISWYNTFLSVEPYIPDKDKAHKAREDGYVSGIKKGAKEAWELARKLTHPSNGGLYENEKKEIFDRCNSDSVLIEMSYQEAKAKYDAWRKQKCEIRVGDEVIPDNNNWKGVVVAIDCEFNDLTIMDLSGKSANYDAKGFSKTGRHFSQVEELMKKMREE